MHHPSPTPLTGAESKPPVPTGGIVRRWGIRYRELVAMGDPPVGRPPVSASRPGRRAIAPGGFEPPTSPL